MAKNYQPKSIQKRSTESIPDPTITGILPITPSITEEDTITRYMVKSAIHNRFFDVSKEDYEAISEKRAPIRWEFYTLYQFKWKVRGDLADVIKFNQTQTELIPGLPDYIADYAYLRVK